MFETCYQLSFKGALHVDGRGTSFYEQAETFIRSDTLSAAMAATWLRLYPDDADYLFSSPPYLLSSAFPFFKDMYFLPRPISSKVIDLGEGQEVKAKTLKKAQWLELSLWQKAVHGEDRWYQDGIIKQGLMMPIKNAITCEAWQVENRPRVTMDRSTSHAADGLMFNFSRVHYHADAGLFFIARFQDTEAKERFEASLALLADSGIGSDRSSGHGHFTFKEKKVQFPDTKQAVCLSLLSPNDEDMGDHWLQGAAYDLVRRGGWISGSSWRKKSVRLFSEGSSFTKRMRGKMLNLGKHPLHGHVVYRDGRALMLGGETCD